MKKEYDFSKAKRGRVAKEIKIIKTFRLDPEVLRWLMREGEKQGMGYQTFLNWYLRKIVNSQKSVEDRLIQLEDAVFNKDKKK